MSWSSQPRVVLAIETSCDETAAAILRGEKLLASVVASQIATHQAYGGVVPEVASRNHLRAMRPVLLEVLQKAELAIDQVDVFAATRGPGLATSLMLGTSLAKGLAVAYGRIFLGVNHLEGHLLSPFFHTEQGVRPAMGLIVSGGHTALVDIEDVGQYSVLGQTRDDAAGEAFDKVGKLLGLPYPGGPQIDVLAQVGDSKRFDFPRSMLDSGDLNFSFSGLKTAVRYLLPKLDDPPISDLCASFQEAVVDVLVAKTITAAQAAQRSCVAVSGGVSCNSRLREKLHTACAAAGLELLLAEPALCTDNAAMIGYVAALRLQGGEMTPLSVDIDPGLSLVA